MNKEKLMQNEQLLLKAHLSQLNASKQSSFLDQYKNFEEQDKILVLHQIASSNGQFLDLAKSESTVPNFQDGGTRFDGDTYVDKYGNTIIQRGPKQPNSSITPTLSENIDVSDKIETTVENTKPVVVNKPVPKSNNTKVRNYDNQGISRDKIRNLQTSLKNAGFDPGPIDGLKGKRTNAALNAANMAGYNLTSNLDLTKVQNKEWKPVSLDDFKLPTINNEDPLSPAQSSLNFTATDNTGAKTFLSQSEDATFGDAIGVGLTMLPVSKIPGANKLLTSVGGKFITSSGKILNKSKQVVGQLSKANTQALSKGSNSIKEFFKRGESVSTQANKALVEGKRFRDATGKFESFSTGLSKLKDTRGTLQKFIENSNVGNTVKTALRKTIETGKRVGKETYNKMSFRQKNEYDRLIKEMAKEVDAKQINEAEKLFGSSNQLRNYKTGGKLPKLY